MKYGQKNRRSKKYECQVHKMVGGMQTRNEDFHNQKRIPPEMVVTYSSKKQEKQKAENEMFV